MSKKVKSYISNLFEKMNAEVAEIVKSSASVTIATQSIMEYVSNNIAAASQGYMVDLYGELSRQTLNEEFFQDPANANRFYELNMRKRISDAYQFDIQNLEAYSTGVDFKEINRVYAAAGAAVGSAAVGCILLGVLSGSVNIPMVVIIAGAVLAGIAGGGMTYAKVVPEKNRANFLRAVNTFMNELKANLLVWVDDVVRFYNENVDELKASLQGE